MILFSMLYDIDPSIHIAPVDPPPTSRTVKMGEKNNSPFDQILQYFAVILVVFIQN